MKQQIKELQEEIENLREQIKDLQEEKKEHMRKIENLQQHYNFLVIVSDFPDSLTTGL